MSKDEPTKAELQEQAREAGVPVSGTKDEIAERLAEAETDSTTTFTPDGPGRTDSAEAGSENHAVVGWKDGQVVYRD